MILSVVVLPMTYLPVLLVTNDGGRLESSHGRLANLAGRCFLLVILGVASGRASCTLLPTEVRDERTASTARPRGTPTTNLLIHGVLSRWMTSNGWRRTEGCVSPRSSAAPARDDTGCRRGCCRSSVARGRTR